MSITNYKGLKLAIKALDAFGVYEFTLGNTGNLTLWHIVLPTYDILGPTDFGLDDTHMPETLTQEEAIAVQCLEPHQCVVAIRKKWGPLSKYGGPTGGTAYATCSLRKDGADRLGVRVQLAILDLNTGRHKDEASLQNRKSRAYSLGKTLGRWINSPGEK